MKLGSILTIYIVIYQRVDGSELPFRKNLEDRVLEFQKPRCFCRPYLRAVEAWLVPKVYMQVRLTQIYWTSIPLRIPHYFGDHTWTSAFSRSTISNNFVDSVMQNIAMLIRIHQMFMLPSLSQNLRRPRNVKECYPN